MKRRDFLRTTLGAAGSLSMVGFAQQPPLAKPSATLFEISLAEWSLHKALFGGQLKNIDFPQRAKQDYGIEAVEFVNAFFKDKAKDVAYLTDLKTRAEGEGVRLLLIMCDGEGQLGDPDVTKRTLAVDNHKRWVEAAPSAGSGPRG